MIIIYSPEGGEVQTFTYRPLELLNIEAEAIESVGGEAWDSFGEFAQKFIRGNRRAWRAALWIMLRKTDPDIRFTSVVYRLNELRVELEPVESQHLPDGAELDELNDDEREAVATASDDLGKEPDGAGNTDS